MIYIGIFKWYDINKGFGVISTLEKDKTEVFFHHSDWRSATSLTEVNKPIVFEIIKRKNKEGYKAINCKNFDSSIEAWKVLFKYKDSNLTIKTDNDSINLMQKCIKMINTTQHAMNFISIFNQWHEKDPILICEDLYDYLIGGLQVTVPKFQTFIKNQICKFSFAEKKDLFIKNQAGLYIFSEEECIQLIESIDKNHYYIILKSNPDLYLKIISKKITIIVKNFSFKYDKTHNYTNFSKEKTEYKILEELYADYARQKIKKRNFKIQ